MKRTGIPTSVRTIAWGLANFAWLGAVTVFLWWVQPIAAGAVGFVVLVGSAPMVLRSTGLRQAAATGIVSGYLVGSFVYLLSSHFGAA